MILYVHIPKTAGTSFRQGLVQIYGRKSLFFDYGRDAPETNEAIRTLYEQGAFTPRRVAEIAEAEEANVICGHFPLSRYFGVFPEATVVGFIREPLQRCYSEYLHWQRHKGYSDSFEYFFQKKWQINLQTKWLDGIPGNGLVGVSEFYDQSLDMINTAIGLSVPALKLNYHRKNIHSLYSADVIGKDIISLFYELNDRDISFYKKVSSLFLKHTAGSHSFSQRFGKLKDKLFSLPIVNRLP